MIVRNTDFMTVAEMETELEQLDPEHGRAYELRRTIGSRRAKDLYGPIRKAARR